MSRSFSRRRVLINCSNIREGGALQVAISVLNDLLLRPCLSFDPTFIISKKVYDGLDLEVVDKTSYVILVADIKGIEMLWSRFNFIHLSFDLVFTLFGPQYTLFKSRRNIVGFAQSWIIDPVNIEGGESYIKNLALRCLGKFKYSFQWLFFKRSDLLVVELDHVKHGICSSKKFPSSKITIVHNCISPVFFSPMKWESVNYEKFPGFFYIGYVCRDYPHKNIRILAKVAKILNEELNLPVKFCFTLNGNEWSKYERFFGNYGVSVGALSLQQCPRFYQSLDAVIFPSLLECFSAAPIEALFMGKPLFATDRDFVRDTCMDFPFYFDPRSELDIACTISRNLSAALIDKERIEEGKLHAERFSSNESRVNKYIDLICKNN